MCVYIYIHTQTIGLAKKLVQAFCYEKYTYICYTHTHTLPIFTPTYIVYIIVTYLSSFHVRLTEEELYPNCGCISHSIMSNSCDPMDCIPPGSSVHGIVQAKTLEWVAMPPPGDLPNPGIVLRSPALQADSLPPKPPGKPLS